MFYFCFISNFNEQYNSVLNLASSEPPIKRSRDNSPQGVFLSESEWPSLSESMSRRNKSKR